MEKIVKKGYVFKCEPKRVRSEFLKEGQIVDTEEYDITGQEHKLEDINGPEATAKKTLDAPPVNKQVDTPPEKKDEDPETPPAVEEKGESEEG